LVERCIERGISYTDIHSNFRLSARSIPTIDIIIVKWREKPMSQRLIDLCQIREEKISRSRAWIYAEIAKGQFPKPLPLRNSSKNLWDEAEVDQWLAEFIAKARATGPDAAQVKGRRTSKALAGRSARPA
jgi:predicted DNA-binding transcriptional regulator AlpA